MTDEGDGVGYALELAPERGARVGRVLLTALVPTALVTVCGALLTGDASAGWLLTCAALALAVSLFAGAAANARLGRLRIDEHGITTGSGELFPWGGIRFVVLHHGRLQVRPHRPTTSAQLVTLHNEGLGLGRARHDERRRAIVAALTAFAPHQYVADRERVLREPSR
ncbi:hypothetical protein [Streptomyces ficellus]|uniref:Uncharacterized protein n=1 Tax=Streptomyces ficellus TaxID=1977088 RepID=A0A6I6FIC4_9ACTN|nr:hypothetical protein [Streptomyces ficellus]QGV78379.1 hypothetical protein EIZ62_09100 [Streptomyces ficellus]